MRIRNARIEDAREIVAFHKQTIRKVNAKDYSNKIIDVWSKRMNVAHFKKRFKEGKRKTFVAVDHGKVVGFLSINLETKRLQALYVDHRFIGQGMGKRLLQRGEDFLRSQGVTKSTMHCTLTAISFYESQGYKKVRWGYTEMDGIKVKDLIMSKQL